MKKVLVTIWLLVGVGLLMKLGHVQGAGQLLILSLSSLAVLYYLPKYGALVLPEPVLIRAEVFAWTLSRRGISVSLIGILFSLQHWPMHKFFLLIGGSVNAVVLLVLLWVIRTHPVRKRTYVGQVMVILGIGAVTALILCAPSTGEGRHEIPPDRSSAPAEWRRP